MITNLEVWKKGERINDWACDTDCETGEILTNGGIENIVEYSGKRYSIISDGDTKILDPNKEANALPVLYECIFKKQKSDLEDEVEIIEIESDKEENDDIIDVLAWEKLENLKGGIEGWFLDDVIEHLY